MSALIALIVGIILIVVAIKLVLGVLGIVIGLALAVGAYFLAEKLIGQGK
nr:hypothetical protein [Sphingomonas sp.]